MSAVHKSSRPGVDLVPVAAATTGTFATGPCRAVRCITVGTFEGVTLAGRPRATQFFATGEVLEVGFISKTAGTADVELIY